MTSAANGDAALGPALRREQVGRWLIVLGSISVGIALVIPAIGLLVCIGLADPACADRAPMEGAIAIGFALLVAAVVGLLIRGGMIAALVGGVALAGVMLNSLVDLLDVPASTTSILDMVIVVGGSATLAGLALRVWHRRTSA